MTAASLEKLACPVSFPHNPLIALFSSGFNLFFYQETVKFYTIIYVAGNYTFRCYSLQIILDRPRPYLGSYLPYVNTNYRREAFICAAILNQVIHNFTRSHPYSFYLVCLNEIYFSDIRKKQF